jgi:hypothetical protein
VRSNSIISRKKDFSKKVKRKHRIQTDEEILYNFEAQFNVLNMVNCRKMYKLFDEESKNPDKLEEIRSKYKFTSFDVEDALNQFMTNFNFVMSKAYKWKTSIIEQSIPETDDS